MFLVVTGHEAMSSEFGIREAEAEAIALLIVTKVNRISFTLHFSECARLLTIRFGSNGEQPLEERGKVWCKSNAVPQLCFDLDRLVRMPADVYKSRTIFCEAQRGKIFMSIEHALFVCQSCAGKWQEGKQVGKSGGYSLYQQLVARLPEHPLASELEIRAVNCLGACSRPCAIALAAWGKSTYIFGDLNRNESLAEVAEAILEGASLYRNQTDGTMKWSERPERLKKGLIGMVPSLERPALA
jgi:predicted metal-binding protein